MAMKDWAGWVPQERAVLVFLLDGPQVLLIQKKRGLGAGKVNGPGGRIEPGETAAQAAARETWEETGITVETLVSMAKLQFQFTTGYALEGEVFLARGWSGTLTACDEADPFWHPTARLPWGQMWADDSLWLPQVLRGHRVNARFVFDGNAMLEAEVEVLDRSSDPIAG